jgi:hypothetical protein
MVVLYPIIMLYLYALGIAVVAFIGGYSVPKIRKRMTKRRNPILTPIDQTTIQNYFAQNQFKDGIIFAVARAYNLPTKKVEAIHEKDPARFVDMLSKLNIMSFPGAQNVKK